MITAEGGHLTLETQSNCEGLSARERRNSLPHPIIPVSDSPSVSTSNSLVPPRGFQLR
jgi:hypothetical protein